MFSTQNCKHFTDEYDKWVDQQNSRMKVARPVGKFSIPCVCQSWPPLAMHPGFVSGSCSGTEKHLRTFRTLILGSGSSCLLNSTSFSRLKTLLLLEVQRRRGKLLHKTFPCTRMLAPHSIPRLRILLQASNGTQLFREKTAHVLDVSGKHVHPRTILPCLNLQQGSQRVRSVPRFPGC